MKKRYLILLGLAAYLISLLVLFPAAPVIARINTQPLQVLGVDGSVWSGSAAQVQAPDAPPLESVNWQLRPLSLLTGALGVEVDFDLLGGHGNTEVAQSLGGDTSIGPATLRLPAKRLEPYLPLPIARFDGALELELDHALLANRQLQRLEGQLVWREARLQSPVVADLGELQLDVAPSESGHNGELVSRGGELDLRGTLNLDQQGLLRVDISIKPRANASAGLRDSLNLLGRPGGDGSWRIRQQLRLSDLI